MKLRIGFFIKGASAKSVFGPSVSTFNWQKVPGGAVALQIDLLPESILMIGEYTDLYSVESGWATWALHLLRPFVDARVLLLISSWSH